jgi:hypothetical protein
LNKKQEIEVLNYKNGCQYHEGKAYLRKKEGNQFPTIVEEIYGKAFKKNDFKTCFFRGHSHLRKILPYRSIETSEPMWMQGIHNKNVLCQFNTKGNKRIPKKKLLKNFLIPSKCFESDDLQTRILYFFA